MEKIEVEGEIFCPVCDELIDGEGIMGGCPHTILISHDYGIEFCDEDVLNREKLEKDNSGGSWDNFTDNLELENCIKYAKYRPAPNFFGVYVIFQLEKEEEKVRR